MKICFMCDLHLSFDRTALQYEVLEWAAADVLKKRPDCIAFCGDATGDGNEDVYDYFIQRLEGTGIPFLYIPGNADLRSPKSRESIYKKASQCKSVIGGVSVYAINDSDTGISDDQLEVLEQADENSVVFMHYPFESHGGEAGDRLRKWRECHKDTAVFFGHVHRSYKDGRSYCLQAMDPDKAIGESPCIAYYQTDTGELRKAYYFAAVPTDLYQYFGISCENTTEHVKLAISNGLKYIELRPDCLDVDIAPLIDQWRSRGGEGISFHLPDIIWKDGKACSFDDRLDKFIDIIIALKIDRITQHVPIASVREMRQEGVLEKLCAFIADKLNAIPHDVVIGIENMHMTEGEAADDSRRYGYIPEECLEYVQALSARCRHKVGVNFDIGHARNNFPFSQKYQISTWFSMLGKHIVGYHMHQVSNENGRFKNHMPIDDIYGELISYASFFRCWATDRINKAPVIFEMRAENAYRITLQTFEKYRKKRVFDIHSHTYYSACGRDNPEDVVRTAVENGLSLFGITDHNHGIGTRKREYIVEMRELARKYKHRIKMLCGIEIATISGLYDLKSPDEIKDYDYCIIEHITHSESIVKDKLFDFCKMLGLPCGIAHTDLFDYCDIYGFDYVEFFENMAKNNIFWEMNVTYDSVHYYNEHQYVFDFMKDAEKQRIIRDAGVYISVGFDGHRHEDYDGFKVHRMYDFLKEHNIKTVEEKFLP